MPKPIQDAPGRMRVEGVYLIENRVNGKVYVGSSVDVYSRKTVHFAKLGSGTHHSKHLQQAWNKYGLESFDFVVVWPVSGKADILRAEQSLIDDLEATNPEFGYNVNRRATSCSGTPKSAEHRAKISKALEGRRPSEATIKAVIARMTGRRKDPEETEKRAAKMRGRPRSDLSQHLARMARMRLFDEDTELAILADREAGMFLREIANKYHCSTGPICRVISAKKVSA